MHTIFLLIPDSALRDAVIEQIAVTKIGEVNVVDTIQSFIKQAAKAENALLVLDEATCDKKQTNLLSELAEQPNKPTLLLLGGGEDIAGINETFVKPLRLGHLMTRLRYYSETAPLLREQIILFGAYRLEPKNRRIIHVPENATIHVTEKETALLVFLAQHNAPVARRDILANVWGYDERIDTHTLETHLYQLRRKLEGDWLISEHGTYSLREGG